MLRILTDFLVDRGAIFGPDSRNDLDSLTKVLVDESRSSVIQLNS